MKRKSVYLSIFVLMLIILLGLTGCGKRDEENQDQGVQTNQSENKTDNNNESQINTKLEITDTETFIQAMNEYIADEDNLDGKSIDNYYNPRDYKMVEPKCSGVISMFVDDFDNDSEDEAIVVRVKDDIKIEACLYRAQNNKIRQVSSMIISEDLLKNGDVMNFDMFTKDIKGETKIFVEYTQSNSLYADGIEWNFMELEVDEDGLEEEEKENTAGSAFMPEDIQDYVKEVKDTGLEVTTLPLEFPGKTIAEQDKNIVRICNIQRKHLDNFDALEYMQSQETNVNYGKTYFTNNVERNQLQNND